MSETYKRGEVYLEIDTDDMPPDPRKEWEHIGTIATWHGRYQLGDEQPKKDPQEFQEELPEGTVILPVYMLDHSGITLSTGPFSCPWDSGQVGIIYVTPDRLKAESIDWSRAEEILKSEIVEYDQYVKGEIYCFRTYTMVTCGECGHAEEEMLDSCTGFFGYDHKESGLFEHAGVENIDDWEAVSNA